MNRDVVLHPAIVPLAAHANYIDEKTIESDVPLRDFIAGFFAYYPGWVKALYAIRWGFVRLLGMKQDGVPEAVGVAPIIPMTAGESMSFFRVLAAQEDVYWAAVAEDRHLKASVAIVREPLAETRSRYHVVTIVHYRHWTGPVYFNVIRPFHHLVVAGMAKAGARGVSV